MTNSWIDFLCVLLALGNFRMLGASRLGACIRTAAQQGWDRLRNGDLLTAAEEAGFDILLTTDKNMRYQQNLAGRRIAVVVLGKQQ